ncbi:MAG: cytochrome c [Flavobacteriales bacterium]|nr:cytochrome c [Flavobacteriales bacterium]
MNKIIHLSAAILLLIFSGCNSSDKKKNTGESLNSNLVINDGDYQNQTELQKSKTRGQAIYTDFCVQCHLPNGKGVPKAFPPLAGSDWLIDKRTESIHAVKFGQSGEIVVNGIKYNNVMPPMGLSDEEVADVMNYVMNSWGNTQNEMVTIKEVEAVKK